MVAFHHVTNQAIANKNGGTGLTCLKSDILQDVAEDRIRYSFLVFLGYSNVQLSFVTVS